MNNTINIQQLAEAIALKTGYTTEFCERFLLELFHTTAEGIADSSRVKIKGFGEFIKSEESNDVVFIPEEAVAEQINEPFSLFEPEELFEDIEEEQSPETVDSSSTSVENESSYENTEAVLIETKVIEVPTTDTEDEISSQECEVCEQLDVEVESTNEDTPDSSEDSTNYITEDNEESIVDEETSQTEPTKQKSSYGLIMFLAGIAIGLIIGAAAMYFIPELSYRSTSNNETVQECEADDTTESENSTLAVSDSICESTDSIANNTISVNNVDTTAPTINSTEKSAVDANQQNNKAETDSIAPVTEKITTTLAALSRKHYGTFEFWVYIYEANKEKLGHPDRVEPGIEVVIPTPELYGIDKNSPESRKRALEFTKEIYERFK